MPLSSIEQQLIQSMVLDSSEIQKTKLCQAAKTTLSEINWVMSQRILTREENKEAEKAVEILMRVEATEKNKGWWFRTKRRLQITQMYLGS